MKSGVFVPIPIEDSKWSLAFTAAKGLPFREGDVIEIADDGGIRYIGRVTLPENHSLRGLS